MTETSTTPNAGRVSFVTRAGARRNLFDGLPSGPAVTGDGSGPTAMAMRERTLYLAIGAGDAERRGDRPGSSVFNVQGESSPILSSVLVIRLSADVDSIAGYFRLTPQIQQQLADGEEVTLDDGAGTTARVAVLVDLPDAAPAANAIYRFSNPWGLALSDDSSTLYLTDASANTLLSVDTATGHRRTLIRFPPSPNSTRVGPPVIDAVPTSVRVYGDQLLVSFLTGFPFIRGASRVIAVDPQQRTIYQLAHVRDGCASSADLGCAPAVLHAGVQHEPECSATGRGPPNPIRHRSRRGHVGHSYRACLDGG